MPAPVIKSIAKQSGKSRDTVEQKWAKAKKAANEKFGNKKDKGYWAYTTAVAKKMSGVQEEANMIPQQMQNDLSSKIKSNPTEVVDSAWDNAIKTVNPKNAEDWSKVVNQTTSSLGLAQQSNPSMPQPSPTAQSQQTQNPTMQNSTNQGSSVLTPQSSIQPLPQIANTTPNVKLPQYPSYGNQTQRPMGLGYNEETEDIFVHTEPQTSKQDQIEFYGLTKFEAANVMIQELRDKNVPENDILFSLVNRLYIDVETARKILNKTLKAKDAKPSDKSVNGPDSDMDGIKEDSVYNHMHISTSYNYPYDSYKFNTQRDPFEFELNSTQLISRAILMDQRYEYEAKFEVYRSNMAKWPKYWDFLKRHNVHEVMKLSVNQLDASGTYVRLMPDNNPIQGSIDRIIGAAVKAFQAYQKLWGKNHFQIVYLSTDSLSKAVFIKALATKLSSGITNLKIDADLSLEFMESNNTGISSKQDFIIVLKNSSGSSVKESKQSDAYDREPGKHPLPGEKISIESPAFAKTPRLKDLEDLKDKDIEEDTESSAFMAAAPENVAGLVDLSTSKDHRKPIPFGGQTGDEINSDAHRHINQMKQGFGTQLESQRMYYLKFSDGHVEAFDSKEERNEARRAFKSKIITSPELFDDLIDDEPIISKDDSIEIDGTHAEIDLKHKHASM